jgi:O-antigen/teichoic acid export membrane protein
LERLKEILANPTTAIAKAKKEKNLNKTILLLMLSWILVSISFFISFYKELLILVAFGSTITIFLFGMLFSVFLSYLINIIMNILGGKGKYYDSLTATTYSSLPLSFGLILMSITSAIVPMLGLLVGFILVAITLALSLSIYFRAIKELYSVDMFTTFIGFLIIIYVFMLSMYLSTTFSIGSALFGSLLPTFRV